MRNLTKKNIKADVFEILRIFRSLKIKEYL